ncbi:MAG: 50S ribosomal protein L4 [Candidatus Saccharibacteria bacterium]|nr:50S ribosomal protein L4 [Candidatus Saccharibacteria bacterium]
MSVATYTKTGNKATAPIKLDKKVFEVEVKSHDLLKQVYETYLSNGRQNLAVTKKRGEVSGGGRKPWRQKGTGRARFGSSRNPIWRGGGIAFGPNGSETYIKKLTQNTKRTALRQALSLAAKENQLIVIDDFAVKNSKTSEAAALLKKIGAPKNVLLVVPTKETTVERALSNLKSVKLVSAMYLNVFDVINADHVVITAPALEQISTWLRGDNK